jgi:hypothetical protein
LNYFPDWRWKKMTDKYSYITDSIDGSDEKQLINHYYSNGFDLENALPDFEIDLVTVEVDGEDVKCDFAM